MVARSSRHEANAANFMVFSCSPFFYRFCEGSNFGDLHVLPSTNYTAKGRCSILEKWRCAFVGERSSFPSVLLVPAGTGTNPSHT